MKKALLIVLLLVILTVSPVLAIFCHKCGVELPEESMFCPACGKPVAGAFNQAPPLPKSSNTTTTSTIKTIQKKNTNLQTVTNTSPKILETSASVSASNYEIINQIETLLSNSNSTNANIRAEELILQHNGQMQSIEPNYHNFNPYQRKLHDLYAKKLKALRTYLHAWKAAELGHDTARYLAEKDKALFVITHLNEAIETLLNNNNNLSTVAKAKEIEMRVQKTTQNFMITSSYLLVDNQRLRRGEPIWIIDVVGAEAKVLHMGHGQSLQPISGWVSIYDLERRSTWRSHSAFFYSNPTSLPIYNPVSAPTIVYRTHRTYPIVIYKGRKHKKHRKKRCDHDYGRRDRGRHKKYMVVEPNYW